MINKFWLAGDEFMPGMHLRQPRFTYSANKEYKNLKKQEIHYIFIKTN